MGRSVLCPYTRGILGEFGVVLATLWLAEGIRRVAGWVRPKHGIIRENDREEGVRFGS
jgi:hypothetical protein